MLCDSHTHRSEADGCRVIDHPLDAAVTLSPANQAFYSLSFHPRRLESEVWDEVKDRLMKELESGRYVAVGEVGLDRLVIADPILQEHCLEEIALGAEQMRLPLILHCVGRYDRLMALVKRMKPTVPWILHGYRGNSQLTAQLTRFECFYFSVGYYFSEEALRTISLDRLLIETDDSGRTIREVYAKVAVTLGIEMATLEATVEKTFRALFKV